MAMYTQAEVEAILSSLKTVQTNILSGLPSKMSQKEVCDAIEFWLDKWDRLQSSSVEQLDVDDKDVLGVDLAEYTDNATG